MSRENVEVVRQFAEHWGRSDWEGEHRIETERVIDAGDRVVLLHREYMRGKNSGVELELEAAVLIDLRDGHIVRVRGYMDRAAALEVAGVGDQAEG